MKTRDEVSAEKLRGGFYTPPVLVDLALERMSAILPADGRSIDVLEPSAGDGAFVAGLARADFADRIGWLTSVELLDSEAAKCEQVRRSVGIDGETVEGSFLGWEQSTDRTYDAAVGNPPFVRFQFVSDEDKEEAARIGSRLNVSMRGVSNLWIPILLGAVDKLRPGGAFAFVVPTECFTGVSAGAVRQWLMRETEAVTFDLFPPGSFPEVLQEVAVMSGRAKADGAAGEGTITVVQHDGSSSREWTHRTNGNGETWTRYLLEPRHLDALETAVNLPSCSALNAVARFEVSAVTGANAFFCVDQSTLEEYELSRWAEPLLPRIRHATGLVFTDTDYQEMVKSGSRSALLHFEEALSDPMDHQRPREYLRQGESEGLAQRYKCRTRTPWYRVPLVRAEPLMMSKRSHHYPRVILNERRVVTTDTIYRGWVREDADISADDFVASFHNSLTLLSAEVEGRSFGGGVLELVPSEIGRLTVPAVPGFGSELKRLDVLSRESQDGRALVDETDGLLAKASIGLTEDLLDVLADARDLLRARRLDRSAVEGR